MAMEGTHIRFALDLKETLGVTDERAYIVGTVYPDSRYLTKIDRHLTHPADYRTNPLFQKDDFFKGWFTHLLCDDIQYKIFQEALPEIGHDIPGQQSREWLQRTALKLLQDMGDIKQFDIESKLPHLDNVINPNNEDVNILSTYHTLLQKMYADSTAVTLDSYSVLWEAFGLDTELGKKLIEQTESYRMNPDIMNNVSNLYEKIISEAESIL